MPETTIDVNDITKFDRTDAELEEFLLLCIVVAGKVAHIQGRKLAGFLDGASRLAAYVTGHFGPPNEPIPRTPFGYLRAIMDYSTVKAKDVRIMLENFKLSPYNKLEHLFTKLPRAELNLRTCTLEQLRAFPGIGPKTARMFLLHSRRDAQHAVLDVHILRFLREELRMRKVPRNTPGEGKTYSRLEKRFVEFAASSGKTPADLDLEIWLRYSRKEKPRQSD